MTSNQYEQALKEDDDLLLWLALKHHKTHKNEFLDFDNHDYLRQIYADKSDYTVVIKSTQCGISEYELVRTMAHALKGLNVFVVFPTDVLVSRFVNGRFNKSMQYTKYYKDLERVIRENKDKRTESMRMIDVGEGNICYVGSNSEANFTEYPADEVIIEELDQCDQKNIEMANERLSHSEYRLQYFISNPTFEGFGIDEKYTETDQMEWQIKAGCGHWIRVDWFKNVVKEIGKDKFIIRDKTWRWNSKRDIRPICHKCGKPFNRKAPGQWVPKKTSIKRGYRVSKLFSGSVTLFEILTRFQKGLKNDELKQRFYNADLGKAYTAEGAKISRKMIQDCMMDYAPGPEKGVIITGIDIGKFYDFVIKRILPDGRLKTLYVGRTPDTETLILTLKEYHVTLGVIDGAYDTREAKKIAAQFKLMFLCYFGSAKNDSIDLKQKTLTVYRLSTLDAVKEAIVTKQIIYPRNIMGNETFLNHMTASTRVFNKDKKRFGKTGVYEWVEGSKEDHSFLATGYCLIAKRLLVLLQDRG